MLTVSDVTTEVLTDDAAGGLPVDPPAPGTTAADTAYVIFTSGSTGRPKGAELDHRGPMNTIRDVNTRYAVGSADVILGVSALTFDLSVWDLFGSLHSGATLVLPTSDEMHPQAWLDLCRRHRVTVWSSVPALMDLLTEQAVRTGANLPDLRLVLLSGDWIPLGLPDRIRSVAPHARIVSLGGATEASIWSIWHEIETVDPAWSSIPYGVPMAGQPWFVLSPDLRECPDRVAGDLYIGGVGLAKGYRNDPERTAAAFVRHPVTGERLYRTGDRGRWTPDGHIELLGRTDFQVKIQGFRVELGDVEHHLSAHPRVTACLVGAAPAGSGAQLQAIVVQDGAGPPVAETALRDHLRERLPRYMVPSVIRTVEHLPLTPNGKVDRCAVRAVADPSVHTDRSARSTAATTPLERTVAQIWADVLERSEPGIDDDFFDLGGQSFAGLRVLARIATDCGSRLPLGALLETPTIRGLCARIESGRAKQTESLVPLVADRPGEPWFVVHPAGGEVLAYRELAALLDRPVHGFAAAPGGPQETTVTELADAYVSDLDLVQPGGPVHLLGWSSGAVIALEMTRLLHDRGREVRHLVLIDAPAPSRAAASGPDEATLLRWFRADLDGSRTEAHRRLGAATARPGGDVAHLRAGRERLPPVCRVAGAGGRDPVPCHPRLGQRVCRHLAAGPGRLGLGRPGGPPGRP